MVYTLTVHLHCNDKPESIDRLKAKLIEASRIYRKDRETVDWIVMQDVHDPRSFTIVERFEQESVRISSIYPYGIVYILRRLADSPISEHKWTSCPRPNVDSS